MNPITAKTEQQTPPPQAVLTQMAMSFIVSQAISVAAKLYIADHLKDGAKTIEDLAGLTETDAPSLYRLMRGLASAGVFQKDADGKFSNNELSEVLRSDHPESIRGAVHMIGDREHWASHGNMLQSVKTGEIAFNYTFGMPVFPYFAEHPEVAEVFDNAMTSFSAPVANAVAADLRFFGSRTNRRHRRRTRAFTRNRFENRAERQRNFVRPAAGRRRRESFRTSRKSQRRFFQRNSGRS